MFMSLLKSSSINIIHGLLHLNRNIVQYSTCHYDLTHSFKLGGRGGGGGGAHLKELRRAEGGAKIFGLFRVKNHDFTPKNHIFSNCGGRCENVCGISCEKSRFDAKNSYFPQF